MQVSVLLLVHVRCIELHCAVSHIYRGHHQVLSTLDACEMQDAEEPENSVGFQNSTLPGATDDGTGASVLCICRAASPS